MRLFLVALASCTALGCATARLPPVAVVVVTFDSEGTIASVASRDLADNDPLLAECAAMVGQIRASLRGPSAGEGTVSFGCPVQNLAGRHH